MSIPPLNTLLLPLLLVLLASLSCAAADGPSNQSASEEVDDVTVQIDQESGPLIYRMGVVMIALNFCGTSYVIARTFIKWRRRGGLALSMALRLPFYIAISDVMLLSIYSCNQIYPLIHGHQWQGTACKVVGGVAFYMAGINMTLVGTIALVTYLRVCRKIFINLGAYDHRLFIAVALFPAVIALIAMPGLGADHYWCFASIGAGPVVPVLALVLNFVVLGVTLFCYVCTLREINRIDTRSEGGPKRDMCVEERVARKIVAYVLIFILQWTPAMCWVAGLVFNYNAAWVYMLTDLSTNFGGIGNCVQYIINEGFYDGRKARSSDCEMKDPHLPAAPARSFPSVVPFPKMGTATLDASTLAATTWRGSLDSGWLGIEEE